MSDPSVAEDDATLTIVRRWAYAGAAAPVEIHVDGQKRGTVDNGDFAAVRCRPGAHDVVVAQFGRASQSVRLTVAPGTRAELVCRCKMSTGRFSAVATALGITLVVFAFLYVGVPAVKPALAPYEKYWGPVFLLALGATLVLKLTDVGALTRSLRASEPGQFLELAEREPTVSDKQVRSRLLADVAKTASR